MTLIPVAARALPNLMACIFLSNLGASFTKVAQDALVAEYGQEENMTDLQPYAFMAAATGGILGNLIVRQINVRLGILNEVFVLRFSRLAETIAQFKILPFTVLFANICPRGSLTSFLASALSLSSIASGFLGVGLASLIGITAGDYSSLVLGIMAQFLAVLLPLGWLHNLPMSEGVVGKERKRGFYRRS
ncbi:hypothetical protein DVH24_018663 [Malus domestica]|uniref:Uncharacterized protein n=1 Tax=Malus domestica TaxID=3750 RepID=A0A498HIH9_MALDO|nr:hypothetical protein DVH24_018663 [Malus domestica]